MGLFRQRTSGGVSDDATPEPEPKAGVHAGVPGRCPQCDGFGYIDNIDMRHRIQTQHCLTCKHTWEFGFDTDGELIDLTDGALQHQRQSSDSAPS